ncbi:hypothetical protein ACTHUF_11385, partial [Neisseria sp. P0024.S006]
MNLLCLFWYGCFNTQPPEGGWSSSLPTEMPSDCFTKQPPEGGWNRRLFYCYLIPVSTHSRPKAAGNPS